MNRNRQITLSDYATCVDQQVDFLHQQEGTQQEREVTRPDVAMFHTNGVSVDAAASDLFHRGF